MKVTTPSIPLMRKLLTSSFSFLHLSTASLSRINEYTSLPRPQANPRSHPAHTSKTGYRHPSMLFAWPDPNYSKKCPYKHSRQSDSRYSRYRIFQRTMNCLHSTHCDILDSSMNRNSGWASHHRIEMSCWQRSGVILLAIEVGVAQREERACPPGDF